MILYGASGHAKVIIDICKKNKIKIIAILDDNSNIASLMDYKVVSLKSVENLNAKFIISIGNNVIRRNIVNKHNFNYAKICHPNSIIDSTVTIGIGSVVMAGVVINSESIIGKHCIVNTSSSIDHDCSLEDFVHISPNATLCGGIKIGEGTLIGAGATVLPNIKIGKWCTIGAGSVIIKDIPDNTNIVGNPGRIIK